MKYILEIAYSRNTGQTFTYRVRKGSTVSLWRTTIEFAYTERTSFGYQSPALELVQTIPFDSLNQLYSDYPELFI